MLSQFLEKMPPYSLFNFWFVPTDKKDTWEVIDLSSEPASKIGTLCQGDSPTGITHLTSEYESKTDDVIAQFRLFSERPEYIVTKPIADINTLDQESLIEAYEVRLVGLVFDRVIRAGKNPDDNIKAAMNCIDWLRTTDFYTAPGSTQYHDSEPSGLLKHSLRVFNHILRLRCDAAFNQVSAYSAGLVALTHDWCKIGMYEMYMRNVKNENTGKWEQVPSYRRNQRGIPLGHGVTSMFLTSKFFRLGTDEALALRWHMNMWNVANNEMNEIQLANESFPLVHLLQFADQLSITKYAN